jgi:hypothetical protein
MSPRRVTMTRYLPVCLFLLALGAAGTASGQAVPAGQVRIARIATTTEVTTAAATVNNAAGRRMTKFVDEAAPSSRAVLDVEWQTPRSGLPAGTVVQFDYRRDRETRVRTQEVRYDEALRGDVKTRFTVPLGAGGAGRVASWRVRVLQAGRVLDERNSASWR